RPVPRWSGLVIEPFVDRLLPRLEVTLDEIVTDGAAAEARIARRQLPPDVLAALGAMRDRIGASYDLLARVAPAIDPTLVRAMQGLRDRSLFDAERAERKLVRAFKRKGSTELRQLDRLRATLRPADAPQERILTVAPWLARYGAGFLPALAAAVEQWYDGALEPHSPAR
ncbi:MAG TPA: bacillithiol biosynthesis BshC, partial [Gemmatimonadales bacterium]|nr:bacillithiol biosynthesis BshC [Gemmatimonadales bacterium]